MRGAIVHTGLRHPMPDIVNVEVGPVSVALDSSGGERVCKYVLTANGFERKTLKWWPKLIRPGATVLDVGAYSGLFSISAKKLGAGRVVALEPMPIMLMRLRENLARNDVEVEVIEAAASDECGVADLTYSPHVAMTSGASLSGALSANPGSLKVKTITIDSLDLKDLCAIKIDVERHEVAVLKGAYETLRRWMPKMIVECWTADLRRAVMATLPPGYRLTGTLDGRNLLLEAFP